MLFDSLPDRFGNALINAWLAAQGRLPDSFNAVERLCYTGQRGMGALEYALVIGPWARQSQHIEIDRLAEVQKTVSQWPSFAARAGVPEAVMEQIKQTLLKSFS